MYADLHIHTNRSDGACSPYEVLELASKNGLKAISITDHDCFTYNGDLGKVALELGLDLVPGIELSTTFFDEEVHLLGYGMEDSLAFREVLEQELDTRTDRNKRMIHNLISLGYKISYDELLEESSHGIAGRPHMASILVGKNYFKSIDEAFNLLLRKGKPGYVERNSLNTIAVAKRIREFGGIAALAHPIVYNDPRVLYALVKENAIDGIECYTSKHTFEDEINFTNESKKHSLLITGGSDFHRPTSNITIGSYGLMEEDYEYFRLSLASLPKQKYDVI